MTRTLQILALAALAVGCAGPNNQTPIGYSQPQQFAPATLRPTPKKGAADLLSLLEGCAIVADDGQPLGVITRNQFAADSILNQSGSYGSQFSATSIFNKFGKYGSQFSALSPFNQFTSTPPKIVSASGELVGYLTKTKFKTPAIDPHLLIGLLKSGR